jgi:hypothetical protein
MIPINSSVEEVVAEMVRKTSPCCLEDLVTYLPNLTWGEVFLAVDRMSRDGRLLLRKGGYSTYQITLPSQLASPRSSYLQKEGHP